MSDAMNERDGEETLEALEREAWDVYILMEFDDMGELVSARKAAEWIEKRDSRIIDKAVKAERERNTGERQYWELRNALRFRFQDQFETALGLMLSNHDFQRKNPCVLPCGEEITPISTDTTTEATTH